MRDLDELTQRVRNPRDLRSERLSRHVRNCSAATMLRDRLDQYDIEIIAEINHAPRYTIDEVVRQAKSLLDDRVRT